MMESAKTGQMLMLAIHIYMIYVYMHSFLS